MRHVFFYSIKLGCFVFGIKCSKVHYLLPRLTWVGACCFIIAVSYLHGQIWTEMPGILGLLCSVCLMEVIYFHLMPFTPFLK